AYAAEGITSARMSASATHKIPILFIFYVPPLLLLLYFMPERLLCSSPSLSSSPIKGEEIRLAMTAIQVVYLPSLIRHILIARHL
ncbi:MAG TPA: hypothetical protein VMW50_09265, partial [Dehalococcoidia bacterium]|nr:hypothetical protein [Dehalococcoidia bacterium]